MHESLLISRQVAANELELFPPFEAFAVPVTSERVALARSLSKHIPRSMLAPEDYLEVGGARVGGVSQDLLLDNHEHITLFDVTSVGSSQAIQFGTGKPLGGQYFSNHLTDGLLIAVHAPELEIGPNQKTKLDEFWMIGQAGIVFGSSEWTSQANQEQLGEKFDTLLQTARLVQLLQASAEKALRQARWAPLRSALGRSCKHLVYNRKDTA